ncbi:HAD hydrolase subfamily IA REG-2-like protein [Athelia psychrophila]|uniref:HAD hydrolase subfamily IA REG-2-like protein n=1 Tax=Athelia psychrophila TaxID=1759441 RepID=A0A166HBH0_9AGAM|nr:HAD hydrolase subfamily IA REG-2-like protein [Fibularhizoctonia sp. CBS 109695]
MLSHIRLVSFDAFGTILRPRTPIFTQYQQAFAPYLGELPEDAIKESFKTALKQVQKEKPAFADEKGTNPERWWGEVIKRTALGAGADPTKLEEHHSILTQRLMHRFSSSEGYELFDDTMPTLRTLNDMGIQTALLSNSDSRMRLVLDSLGVTSFLKPILVSEETGVEKPAREMFRLLLDHAALAPEECLHVGDELECDYYGARDLGMSTIILRRPGTLGDSERKEATEDISGLNVASGLEQVVTWVRRHNEE